MIYIFLATILYAFAIIGGAFASRGADPVVVAAITNSVAAIIPILLIVPAIGKISVQDQKLGMIVAAVAGVLIAFFVIFLNKAFVTNKVAIVTPIVYGGSIFLTAVISYFLFKEKISIFQGIGLAFLVIGIIFITYARLTGK